MNIEIWKPIIYEDIILGKYEVSDRGRIRTTKSNKLLIGCNPNNEKGYIRVQLQTINKPRKFAVHRLVANAFIDNSLNKLEVNHIDGNPLNNNINNLEYATRLENAHHAAINHLYITCEDHHKANFTNNQIHEICHYLSKGYHISKIIREMKLSDIDHIIQYITRIKDRKTWTNISSKYTWDNDKIKYKTYSKCEIEMMCEFLFIYEKKPSWIVKQFPQYDNMKLKNVLKKIKELKLYTDISIKYIDQDKRSTTNIIDNDYLNIIIQ